MYIACLFYIMKERIQQFIDYKKISPGDLSNALDVQRSNISHILNGRNKPGAAFIEKFLLVYPDLNARWLLTGQGNMINDDSASAVNNSEQDSNIYSNKVIPVTEEQPKKSTADKIQDKAPSAKEKEEVERIILLNSDGTFSIYNQNK